MNDFFVVVRGCNERTCYSLGRLLDQYVGINHWKLVEATPFEETLRKCYREGMQADRPYTVTIDADVLPAERAFQNMVAELDGQSDDVFELHGQVLDKAFQAYRQGGIRVYRTTYLKQLLETVPLDGKEIRPEAYCVNQLMSQGLKTVRSSTIVGLHGYEQNYMDLFRNGYVLAIKYNWLWKELESLWCKMASGDPDFRMLLLGAYTSQVNKNTSVLDKKTFPEEVDSLLAFLQCPEKPALEIVSSKWIADTLEGFEQPVEAHNIDRVRQADYQTFPGQLGPLHTMWRHGLKSIPWFAGKTLEVVASKLKQLSKVAPK